MQADDQTVFDKPGNKKLPAGVPIVYHVAGRIRELRKLYNDIATTKTDMLLHQMLPNHMRRRAMSHNPKRIPLKYRQIHISQMAKSGPNVKKRRPSRKYRRKPNNLMKEYIRRAQKNVWMETHVWHAKRYHMKELWGYKIPYASTDKRYRASYKAAANHCLLQDMSFTGAIEVSGPLEVLREGFKRITSQDCGLTIMAKSFQNGTREGNVDLFKADSYPSNAIARVSFIWATNCKSSVWIFVHPTAYREVLEELVGLFHLKSTDQKNGDVVDTENFEAADALKSDSQKRNPKYVNNKSGVEIVELKDTLNRFRLTGPYSNAVLHKALKTANRDNVSWLGKLCGDDSKFENAHEEQKNIWKDLEKSASPSELPPHIVLGMNIVDPRTNRPAKREKAVNEFKVYNNGNYLDVPVIAAQSPIWSKELRDEITRNMMPTGELCKLRSKNQLVPGVVSKFESDLQPVPILLIQRPGSQAPEQKRLGLGSGWDVIVPAGYGMSVWLSLIRCGAKSGGWREIETIANEMSMELFAPDNVSGVKEDQRHLRLNREKFFRLPPNKRTNYKKMAIASPFGCPWSQLVKEWGGSGNFHVLRSRTTLEGVEEVLRGKRNLNDLKIPADALIPINISMETRGTPGDFGIICLPSKRDIKTAIAQKYQRDRGPISSEPLTKDDAETDRKMMRSDHKKLLKRLRNRRVRAKRKLQATANHYVKIQKSSAEKIIEEHYEKMCELWLPRDPPSIRLQCSKQVFGYLNQSRFTFSEGKVSGVGYVTREGLAKLTDVFKKFKGLKPFVLTRATNSKSYYSASLGVRMQS